MKIAFIFIIVFFQQFLIAGEKRNVQPFLTEIFTQFPSVRDFTITPGENEAYFTAQSPLGEISVIMFIKKEQDRWQTAQIAPFSGKYSDLEPFLTTDGLKLYFASNRPADNSGKVKDYDIWYVERDTKTSSWSVPKNPGAPLNSGYNEFYPSVAANGNMYFTCDAPASRGKDDIFISRWNNGRYSDPVSLSDSINTDSYEFNAFIAADESFLVFSGYNREDGLGSGDLYISYRSAENTWGKAKNLGRNVNSSQMDYCPYFEMNSGTLYFTSRRSNYNELESGFTSLNDLIRQLHKYENGLSRIYKIYFKDIIAEQKK